jgi:hypothetical protein
MDEHTRESHERIKTDDVSWSHLERVGLQHVPAFENEPAETLELVNCTCGSTLARRIP